MGEVKRRASRGEVPFQQEGQDDRDAAVHELASTIDERVRQLEGDAQAITDRVLMEQMLGFLPALQQIWTGTSDQTLSNLCVEYPGFCRYAQMVEDAFEAQRNQRGAAPVAAGLEPLPDSVKPVVALLMGKAAKVERELQHLVDAVQRQVALGGPANPQVLQAQMTRVLSVAELHKEYVAGLDPTSAASTFKIGTAAVPGQPGQTAITFGPIVAGRTYVVTRKASLAG